MSELNTKTLNNYRAALFLWGAGLFTVVVLSLLPPGNEPSFSNFVNDKIKHFTAYALLAHMACHAGRNWRVRITLCAITLIVSILIEFLQPFTGRDFELFDIVANLSGVFAGIALMVLFLRWRSNKFCS